MAKKSPQHEILFFPNGNTAVFKNNEQVSELQKPWAILFAKFLESKGENPENFRISFPIGGEARYFRTSKGDYNWSFKQL